MPSPSNEAKQIQSELIAGFTAAQAPGLALASVKTVAPTLYPDTDEYPFLGISLMNRSEDFASNGYLESICTWGITISVKGGEGTLLRDAEALRDTLIDDGNGGGVEPILRSYIRALFNTATCWKAQLVGCTPIPIVAKDPQGVPTECYAEAALVFKTWQRLPF